MTVGKKNSVLTGRDQQNQARGGETMSSTGEETKEKPREMTNIKQDKTTEGEDRAVNGSQMHQSSIWDKDKKIFYISKFFKTCLGFFFIFLNLT